MAVSTQISNDFLMIFLEKFRKVLNNRGKDLKSFQKLLFYLENMILGVKNAWYIVAHWQKKRKDYNCSPSGIGDRKNPSKNSTFSKSTLWWLLERKAERIPPFFHLKRGQATCPPPKSIDFISQSISLTVRRTPCRVSPRPLPSHARYRWSRQGSRLSLSLPDRTYRR